jgi:hypothetical protein
MNPIKQKLYDLCVQYAGQRVNTAQEAIRSAKESSESDTKSSAGDKYETGREMMQQEIARNEQQLHEARKLLHAISRIPQKDYSAPVPGALVVTDQQSFYLSISAGQLELDGEIYFAISPSSPIGMKLAGLQVGDDFTFNQKTFTIEKIL